MGASHRRATGAVAGVSTSPIKGHVRPHGDAEKSPSDLTVSGGAWFKNRREAAARDSDVLLLYRGPGDLPCPRSRRARPSFLTQT